MTKFHINKKGVPAVCRAKKGNCPFGGENEHYNTKEEAEIAAQEKNSKENSLLPGIEESNQSEVYKNLESVVSQGNFKYVESQMTYHKAEDVYGAYKKVKEIRDRGDIRKTIDNLGKDLLKNQDEYNERINEIQQELYRNTRHPITVELTKLEKEQLDLQMTIDAAEEKANAINTGDCPKCGKGKLVERNGKNGPFIACTNFPNCKHTQNKVQVNSAFQKKLDKLEKDYNVTMSRLKKEAIKVQNEDPIIVQLKENKNKIENELKLAMYIDIYQNPRLNRTYPKRTKKSMETPIEIYYKDRKVADEKIMNEIGENEVVLQSGKMKFGASESNKINADLKVNEKGEINNLYIENSSSKGDIQRVTSITPKGTILLENGEEIHFAQSSNWKAGDKNPKPSNNWKFYATKGKGKKYEGNTTVRYDNFDSGD